MFISRFYARYLPALMLILILVASAFAFADSNFVPESGAGDGDGDISGYTVSNIDYTLNANPTLIDTVEFDIDPTAPSTANAPDVVKIQFNNAGSWYDCDATTTSGHAVCNVSAGSVTVLSATNLRVVAAE
jgi:hypothetical protein